MLEGKDVGVCDAGKGGKCCKRVGNLHVRCGLIGVGLEFDQESEKVRSMDHGLTEKIRRAEILRIFWIVLLCAGTSTWPHPPGANFRVLFVSVDEKEAGSEETNTTNTNWYR